MTRSELLDMSMDDLRFELTRASRRLASAKRGRRAGTCAPMDVDQARKDFALVRGVYSKLNRFGAC